MRVPGTAVYLTRDPNLVPHALVLNLQHNKVLHERIVFLAMFTEAYAYVAADDRVMIETLSPNVYRVTARHGFAEDPEILGVVRTLPRERDWTSTWRRRRSSWAARRCWRRTVRGWRYGESDCSHAWRATPAERRATSGFRRTE